MKLLLFFALSTSLAGCMTYEVGQDFLNRDGHIFRCQVSASSNHPIFYLTLANEAEDQYRLCVKQAQEVGYIAVPSTYSNYTVAKRMAIFKERNGQNVVDPLKKLDEANNVKSR